MTSQPTSTRDEPEEERAPVSVSRRGFLRVAGLAVGGRRRRQRRRLRDRRAPAWSFGAPATPGAATAAPGAAPPPRLRGRRRRAVDRRQRRLRPPRLAVGRPPAEHAGRLDRARRRGPRRRPPLRRQPRARPSRASTATRSSRARGDPRRRDDYPELHAEAGLRPGPAPRRHRRRSRRSTPEMDGDVKVFDLTDRRDRLADRRAEAAGRGPRLQQAVAGPGPDPRHRGRQGPGRLHEQPARRRRASTSTASSSTTSSRTASRSSPSCRSSPGESFTYEFTAEPARLADVPLAPQRDRPGRARPAGRLHRGPEDADGADDKKYDAASTSGSRNDALGGFTINGHGFPATVPVLAAQGETVRVRFMNEGIMMHPWHPTGTG